MANIIKKPYEISLWDEVLIFKTKCFDVNGNLIATIIDEKKMRDEWPENTNTTETFQYYKERKIAIIGSDTMDTPIRAVNSKLVSNVNGANTLTFSMYSKYWDEEAESFYDNPFLKLLSNERKIKVRYGAIGASDCKWYDLIIKNVQENSDSKIFTYTAKDQFINELSKSGFELVLDTELENNMGNITKLANTVLEGTDWKLGSDNSRLIQYKEEPLYMIQLNKALNVTNMLDSKETATIPQGAFIYGFYSTITEKDSFFQLLYTSEPYEVDDNYVITNSKIWFVENVNYIDEKPDFANSMAISDEYRGKRLVRQPQTEYDTIVGKYVQLYKDSSNTIYRGYTETEYVSPVTVQNFVTAPNGFTSFSGWDVGGITSGSQTIYPTLDLQGFPDLRDIPENEIANREYISLLKFKATSSGQKLFNSGINDNRSVINGITSGDKFVFRIKYAKTTREVDGRPQGLTYQTAMPTIKIGTYELRDGIYTINSFFNIETHSTLGDYVQATLISSKSFSYSEMIRNKFGIFIEFPLNTNFYIEDVQFFRYVTYEKDGKQEMAIPGGELVASVKTKYFYYIKDEANKTIDDIKFSYEGYEPWKSVSPVYNSDTFEKIRSITAKESNRFNLIQTLCETFECWPKFTIEHNMATGEILLDESDGYRQKKWVTFHEYIGKDNYAGFKYGINLKSIQRTLDSNATVSKLIVKNNANQYAENGFCSIARAKENPIGENFLFDFSYYVRQGLMSFSTLNNDLYLDVSGYLGYYKKLRNFNKDRDLWIEEQAGLLTDISEFQAQYQTYRVSVDAAQEELRATEVQIKMMTGYSYQDMVKIYNGTKSASKEIKEWWNNQSFIQKINKLAQLKNTIARHTILRDNSKKLWDDAQARFDEVSDLLEDLANEKRALNLQLYKKYSRFIQEGSWIKEDYIDDNLYYLDAESTLHTSTQPKVTYNINVLELSQLEGYENYKFELGDKTFIEDTEFFGWVFKNNLRTPYHEEIVVTELTTVFDSPEQNIVKVQNYKTQFEDLFQRITATTQSIEYHTGEYGRAASVVETDGTIVAETLENSIANNAIRLENAKDQSVVWDDTGITTTSLSKPNEIVRLVSGGLFLSNDGGVTWNTGITGSGINATYITSGYLNTGLINIMHEGIPSFRWDGLGLNAYQFQVDENGNPYGYNIAKFVRFDQYGFYGINGATEFDPNTGLIGTQTPEDKIWENANYALTWKGFMLKNDDGSVRITSTNDIQVIDANNNERIKIGRIVNDYDDLIYGIRISNASGAPVMETDDQGELWLKNKLEIETYKENTNVRIGKIDTEESELGEHGGRVIDANRGFIVYEDGHMVAQSGEFYGKIYATGGQIGGLTVDQWAEKGYDLVLTSNKGNSMKNGTAVTLTAQLYHGSDTVSGVTYEWYDLNNENVILHTGQQYNITVDFTNGFVQYGCKATMS